MEYRFVSTHGYVVLHMAMVNKVTIVGSVFAMLEPMSVHMKKYNSNHGVVGRTL